MDLKEVYENLCYRDARNPSHEDAYPDGTEVPNFAGGCFCDNCHNGRHELALELIRLVKLLKEKG